MSRREPSRLVLLAAAKAALPRGWRLRERRKRPDGFFDGGPDGLVWGLTHFNRRLIEVVRIETRADLFVFLHEVGHVHCGHADEVDLTAQHEYEAETWAIRAMRGMGFAVPRSTLAEARHYVASLIRDPDDESPEVLRFAYGARL